MSELEVVQKSTKCHTTTSLIEDLKQLGVQQGDTLLVHSSLSQIGWVCGREIAVIDALTRALGNEGTLVMPSFSGENSDPSNWQNPPVPESWIQIIKDNMPAFNPRITPTRQMGRIADAFIHYEGTIRSYHPDRSFSARGKHAQFLTQNHVLEEGFSKESPLYRLYDMNAKVLLLGVGYGNCTCMHLAEIMHHKKFKKSGGKIYENGVAVWKEYEDVLLDDEPFPLIGKDYEQEHAVIIGKVGDATCRLLNIRDIVDYTYLWLAQHDYE